jgi:hypothetical protein
MYKYIDNRLGGLKALECFEGYGCHQPVARKAGMDTRPENAGASQQGENKCGEKFGVNT